MSTPILASRLQRTAAGDYDCAAIHPDGQGSKEQKNMGVNFVRRVGKGPATRYEVVRL
jgi:hypothetical protein